MQEGVDGDYKELPAKGSDLEARMRQADIEEAGGHRLEGKKMENEEEEQLSQQQKISWKLVVTACAMFLAFTWNQALQYVLLSTFGVSFPSVFPSGVCLIGRNTLVSMYGVAG